MSIDRSAWRKDIGNKERRKRCNDDTGERVVKKEKDRRREIEGGREVESWME